MTAEPHNTPAGPDAGSPPTATDAPPVIELIDLHKTYRVGTELVHALRGTSLKINENEYVAIMGASGSGKSTMLNILGCLDVPTKGAYRLRGQDVSKLSQTKLARIRGRQIGFVFQSFELLGRTTALKNVELPLRYTRTRHRRRRALEALERVNLLDRAHHRPNQLSGGQKQRVALARALAQQPDIILADEPTGNLDTTTGEEIMEVFDSLCAEGQTIVIVTHEDHIARRCRRTIKLSDGQIVSDSGNGQARMTGAPDRRSTPGAAS
jgi:putative ABC transport system ATP-binding protein